MRSWNSKMKIYKKCLGRLSKKKRTSWIFQMRILNWRIKLNQMRKIWRTSSMSKRSINSIMRWKLWNNKIKIYWRKSRATIYPRTKCRQNQLKQLSILKILKALKLNYWIKIKINKYLLIKKKSSLCNFKIKRYRNKARLSWNRMKMSLKKFWVSIKNSLRLNPGLKNTF